MSAVNTNFLNSKGRRIYKGERGSYFVKRADGKKVYGLRAAFRQVGANGVKTKLTKSNIGSIPSPLRRAARKNAGVKRKSPAARKAPVRRRKAPAAPRSPNQGALQRKMNNEAKRLALARVKKALKPRAPRARPVRSPNQGALQRKMNNEAKRLALARVKKALKPVAVRAVRKNAGIKRGPLKNGTVRKVPVRRRKTPARKSPLMLMMNSQVNILARRRANRLARARVARALKPRAPRVLKPRAPRARLVRSPNQGALLRKMNAQSKRLALARAKRNARAVSARVMISSPGGTVYKSKRSMAAKKKALSRIKAMNDLLKAISPNPFSMLLNKPKRRTRAKK